MKFPSIGWLVLVVMIFGAYHHLTPKELIALFVASMIGWYAWSCQRRPGRRCWWCGGSGVREGSNPEPRWMWRRKPVRKCWICRNVKVNPRWGTAVFNQEDRKKLIRERNSRPPGGV